MCAIDALGIAPMFGEPIEVESRDPVSGDEIQAQVAPDGTAEWWPESAVVVAGAIRSQGDACCGCCPVLNFFVSPASAERWLAQHPEGTRRRDLGARGGRRRSRRLRRCAHGDLMPTPIDRHELQRLLAERHGACRGAAGAEHEDEHLPGAINIRLKNATATRSPVPWTSSNCQPPAPPPPLRLDP
jgi:Alkylmercury lyase